MSGPVQHSLAKKMLICLLVRSVVLGKKFSSFEPYWQVIDLPETGEVELLQTSGSFTFEQALSTCDKHGGKMS